jgi:endo-1,4-beta-xylanase
VLGWLAIGLALGLAGLLGGRELTRDDDVGMSLDRQEAATKPPTAEAGGRPSPEAGRPVLGAAVEWDLLRKPGRYQRLFLQHYSSLTPENAMKMDALAPTPDGFDFRRADGLVEWALDHGVAVHGHVLVWHRQVPAWLTARDWTRRELRTYLRRYITTVVRHFRGRVRSWDVVNEPLTAGGSLRRSIWERALGPGYVADALRWAHRADPQARLYLNEFDLERAGPKSAAMYRLLRELRRRHVPLDGIGLQAHLTPEWRPTGRELRAIMERYAGLGLDVDISEMDVPVGPGEAALVEQARIYRTVAAGCRRLPQCGRFTTWGFTDASTWLGTAQRPLPFSSTGVPKPAWRAITGEFSR